MKFADPVARTKGEQNGVGRSDSKRQRVDKFGFARSKNKQNTNNVWFADPMPKDTG